MYPQCATLPCSCIFGARVCVAAVLCLGPEPTPCCSPPSGIRLPPPGYPPPCMVVPLHAPRVTRCSHVLRVVFPVKVWIFCTPCCCNPSSWVGAWWISFLFCGGVSLTLALVGLRFPRFFHGDRALRDVTAGPSVVVLPEAGPSAEHATRGSEGVGEGCEPEGEGAAGASGNRHRPSELVGLSSPAPVVSATMPLMMDRGDDDAPPQPPPLPPGTLWSRFRQGALLVARTRIVLVRGGCVRGIGGVCVGGVRGSVRGGVRGGVLWVLIREGCLICYCHQCALLPRLLRVVAVLLG